MLVRQGECARCGKICCPENCIHLTPQGLCDNYEHRPNECHIYPANPAMLESGYTFWFEDSDYPETRITWKNWNDEKLFPMWKSREWMVAVIGNEVIS